MIKKFFSLFLALTLILSLGQALADVTPAGEFPITDAPAELTVWAPLPGTGQDEYDICMMTSWFEEMTGIHVNWISCNSSEYQTVFNTSIASGQYPDIYCIGVDGPTISQLAEDGIAIPLNDLIDNYGYYIKEFFEANPDVRKEITAPDGNIYTFVNFIASYSNGIVPNKLWVYKEWLDRYEAETGNPAPDTPAALRDMLAFFRDNDMNGNGDASDEIPMTGNYNWGHEGGNPAYYILNGFVFLPTGVKSSQFLYVGDDGKVTTDVTKEEFREGLKYLNELYKDGLFAEEIFVQDLNTMRSTTSVTRDQVVVATGGAPYSLRLLTAQPSVENSVTYEDYVVLPPLKKADGVAVTPSASEGYSRSLRTFITKDCKNPELAFRWMDFFYSDVVQAWMLYGGTEGGEMGWNWVDSESLAGDSKAIRSTMNAQELLVNCWNGDWCGIKYRTMDLVKAAEKATSNTTTSWDAYEVYAPYAKVTGIPTIVWCDDPDVAVDYSTQMELIKNYVENSISEFTLGVRDINDDAAWNEYLATLEGMHLADFLKLADEYYGLN